MDTDPKQPLKFTPKDSGEWLIVDALIGAGAAVEGAKTEKEREAALKRVAKYQALIKTFHGNEDGDDE